MVDEVVAATGLVVTVKVAVVAFAATVTLAGTCAAAVLLLDRVTIAPSAGAGPVRATVPVELAPPMTEAGLTPTELSVGAVAELKFAMTLAPLMVTAWLTGVNT